MGFQPWAVWQLAQGTLRLPCGLCDVAAPWACPPAYDAANKIRSKLSPASLFIVTIRYSLGIGVPTYPARTVKGKLCLCNLPSSKSKWPLCARKVTVVHASHRLRTDCGGPFWVTSSRTKELLPAAGAANANFCTLRGRWGPATKPCLGVAFQAHGSPRTPWACAGRRGPSFPRSRGCPCGTRRRARSDAGLAVETSCACRDRSPPVSIWLCCDSRCKTWRHLGQIAYREHPHDIPDTGGELPRSLP